MPSLPPIPGFDDVSGAVCRGTWAFCWRDGDAAFWCASRGWITLPRHPRPILDAIGTDDGLALLRAEATVEFREWGNPEPRWARDIELPYGDVIHLAASFVVHGTRDNVATSWTAEEIRPDGRGASFAFVAPGREPPLALFRRPGGRQPIVVVPQGVAVVPPDGGRLEPRAVGWGVIDGPSRLASLPRAHPDVALFDLRAGATLLLRVPDASCEVVGLWTPPGFEELWPAWLEADPAALRRILSIYDGEPPPLAGDGPLPCLGVVLDDAGLPAAVLTHEGLVELSSTPRAGSGRHARSWASGRVGHDDLLAWRLLAGEEGVFPDLVERLLAPGSETRPGAIGLVLSRERPAIAGRALLEKARGRRPSEVHAQSESAFARLLGEEGGVPDVDLLAAARGDDPMVAMIAAVGLCGRWAVRKGKAGPPGREEREAVFDLLDRGEPAGRAIVLRAALDAGMEDATAFVLPILRTTSEDACTALVHAVCARRDAFPEVVEEVLSEACRAAPDVPLRKAVTRRPLLERVCPGPAAVPVALDLMDGVVDHRLSSLVGLLANRGPWVSLPQAIEAIAVILSGQLGPTELPESRNASTFDHLHELAEGWGKEPSAESGDAAPGRPLSPALLAASLSTVLFARAWSAGGLNWKESSERSLLRRTGRDTGALEPLVADAEDVLSSHLPALAKLARLCGIARRLDGRLAALLASTVLLASVDEDLADPAASAPLTVRLRLEGERRGPRRELLRLCETVANEASRAGDLVRKSLESIRPR